MKHDVTIMIWACFVASSAEQPIITDETMNCELQDINEFEREKCENSCPQDSDPEDTRCSTTQWLKKNKTHVFQWSGHFPDPMEVFVKDLKREVDARKHTMSHVRGETVLYERKFLQADEHGWKPLTANVHMLQLLADFSVSLHGLSEISMMFELLNLSVSHSFKSIPSSSFLFHFLLCCSNIILGPAKVNYVWWVGLVGGGWRRGRFVR